MIDWGRLIAKLVSMIMSWADAGNLRNRVYELQEEVELMETALDDIRRMDPEGRIGWLADNCLNTVRQQRYK